MEVTAHLTGETDHRAVHVIEDVAHSKRRSTLLDKGRVRHAAEEAPKEVVTFGKATFQEKERLQKETPGVACELGFVYETWLSSVSLPDITSNKPFS